SVVRGVRSAICWANLDAQGRGLPGIVRVMQRIRPLVLLVLLAGAACADPPLAVPEPAAPVVEIPPSPRQPPPTPPPLQPLRERWWHPVRARTGDAWTRRSTTGATRWSAPRISTGRARAT